MEALISPSARIAGIVDGDNAWLLNESGDAKRRRVRVETLQHLFDTCDDAIRLPEVTDKIAIQILCLESSKDELLALILTVLDPETNEDIRSRAAVYAEEYLGQSMYYAYLRGIMFARPLPAGVVSSLPSHQAPVLSEFIRELTLRQDAIRTMSEWLNNFLSRYRVDQRSARKIEGTLTNKAVFARLSDPDSTRMELDQVRFSCLVELENVPSSRPIIGHLFREFGSREVQVQTVVASDTSDEARSEQHKRIRAPRQTPHAIFQGVQAQIARVAELLEQDNIDLGRRFADELVREQVDRGEGAYAAMSLCNLSEKAKALGDYSLQLVWAKQAAAIAPEDARSFSHLGEALLNLGRLQEARLAFEEASRLGDKIFGTVGVARVLRRVFRYEDALSELDGLIAEDCYDSTVENLKASLLRDLGRHKEAESLYAKLIEEYPGESWPLCGYAAVLADMGRYDDAERMYSHAITVFPSDHVPRSGLGFVLVRQGKFSEGLRLLDQSIARNSTGDLVPTLSKITALRWAGKYKRCIELCDEMIKEQPNEIAWRLALVHSHIEHGEYTVAAEVLGSIKQGFTNEDGRVARYEAFILRRRGKLVEALHVLDRLKAEYPMWLDAIVDRGNVLKHLGNYELASRQFEEILGRYPNHRAAKNSAAILAALVSRKDESVLATLSEEPVGPNEWRNLHARALILIGSNRVREAKKLLLKGAKKCPFASIRSDFFVPLAAARTMLGQVGTAIRTARHARDDIGLVQLAIILGELGRVDKAKGTIQKVDSTRADIRNVVNLVERRYVSKRNTPSIEEVMRHQVDALLRAA